MKSLFVSMILACGTLLAGLTHDAIGSDAVAKVKAVKVLPKTTIKSLGSDRMLNPQPLPPRQPSVMLLMNRFDRVSLNPQPLPPNPPDPKLLRNIKMVR